MRVFGITVCHMDPDIIAFSLNKVRMTMGLTWVEHHPLEEWVVVDNKWPIKKEYTSRLISDLCYDNYSKYHPLQADENLGGIKGFNLALEYLNKRHKLQDTDLIFGIDPDTNPIQHGWGVSMRNALMINDELDAVSLMIKTLKPIRPWQLYKPKTIMHGTLVKHFDMYNATCWRYRAIKDGLKANLAQYYGGVELGMRHLNHAYLYDFEEDHCPIPHPQCYNDWKRKHAFEGYLGNFDQYVKEFHPELL